MAEKCNTISKRITMEDDIFYFYMCANNYLMHLLNTKKKPKQRRWWMMTIHRNRTQLSMERQFSELRSENAGQFLNFFRMSEIDFEYLLNKIGPTIAKKDTRFRKSIPAKLRLAITLRFLASGDTFRSLHYLFKVSHKQISEIVADVCEALILNLKWVVQLPSNQEDWLAVEHEFKDIFPHCIGAIDGKHVQITSPHFSGTTYFNYKHTFSIVLLALVDKDFCFLFADIGCQGRISDGGVFRECLLNKKLQECDLDIPSPSPLPGGPPQDMPYVFVADNAFPLAINIMKPYPGDHQEGSTKRIFNRKLSRARIVVENAFGVMSAIFRVLRKPICLEPAKASNVVMTCVLLHNFLRKSRTSRLIYNPHGYTDRIEDGEIIRGSWRDEVQSTNGAFMDLPPVARRSPITPLEIRSQFAEYFSSM